MNLQSPPNSPAHEVDITFFVACYNEAENIIPTLNMLASTLADFQLRWEIVVIDDASSDDSVKLVKQYMEEHTELDITLVVNAQNKGLGTNYIDGAFIGRGRYYRLICGDNVELKENLTEILKRLGTADMIIPYAISSPGRSMFRQYLSRGFTTLVNVIRGYKIRYYNGLAVHLRHNVMRWHGNYRGFGFQADLITRLLDENFSFVEVPVINGDRTKGQSKALTLSNFLSVAHFLFDLGIRRIGNEFFHRKKTGKPSEITIFKNHP